MRINIKYRVLRVILACVISLGMLSISSCDLFSGITIQAAVVTTYIPILATTVSITVQDKGSPVDDAVISVNGENVPNTSSGTYTLTMMGIPVAAGGNVQLLVARGKANIDKTLTVPSTPTGISHNNSPVDTAISQPINWTTVSPTPSQIAIVILSAYTVSPSGFSATVAGTDTSHTIPANTLKPSTVGITVQISSINSTLLGGAGVTLGSIFAVSNVTSSLPPFATQ